VDNIILATGDGHFSNIVARMKIRDGKRVIVVGVKGSISRELQMAAGRDNVVEITGFIQQVDNEDLKRFILTQEERYRYLTFIRTAQAYLDRLKVPEEYRNCVLKKIILAMNRLIEEGYLEQLRIMRNDAPVNIIKVAGQKNVENLG